MADELSELKDRVRRLEDFIAGPGPSCPECIQPMFPRLSRGGEVWKPGLVFSEEAEAWWDAFHVWEQSGSVGDPPQRPEKTYRPCRTCSGDGLKPETEEERAERIRLKVYTHL